MTASSKTNEKANVDPQWHRALTEVEEARLEYAKALGSGGEEEGAVGRHWLRLWRAERHRDELSRDEFGSTSG